MTLSAGDEAPAFALPDQDGTMVELGAFRGRKVLVYFYPKADTPGCTTQAQELTKILGDIGDAAVLGISPDPPRKLKRFAEKFGIAFPLLGDEDHAVAEAYHVWQEKSMYARTYMGIVRSAFLVDGRACWPGSGTRSVPGTRRCASSRPSLGDAAAGHRSR